MSSWANIKQIDAGYTHTVGLKTNGTVVAVGNNSNGQCDVSLWNHIKQVSTGWKHTVGLKFDGTAVAVGANQTGGANPVISNQCDVSSWNGIKQVSAGHSHTVGLKANGTVVAVGNNTYGQCDVSSWTDIIQVSAGDLHTIGLKEDGTVAAVGYNEDGQCNVSSWSDIQQVDAGEWHTLGLKTDGTVVSEGTSYIWGKSDGVVSWTNIQQVSAGSQVMSALRNDGMVLEIWYNDDATYNRASWELEPAISILYYRDLDDDGYGDPNTLIESESQPFGYVVDNTDCNDNDDGVHPGATEIRDDGIDQDCNGSDLLPLVTYYLDADADGYGDPNVSIEADSQPEGYVTDGTDYDDQDSNVLGEISCTTTPGAVELISPTGTTVAMSPTFRWNSIECAPWYKVLLKNTTTGEKFSEWYEIEDNYSNYSEVNCSNGTCNVTPDTTLSDGDYEWWVRTWNDFGNGLWSSTGSFTLEQDEGCTTTPGAVTLTAPTETTSETSPALSWNSNDCASWYKVLLKNTTTGYKFSQWYEIEDNFNNYPEVDCTGGNCMIIPDVNLPSGDYYWWVRTWNDFGNGLWSDGISFSITE